MQSAYLCYRWVFAEVEVTAEVAVVADDLWEDVGVTGVMELSLIRKLSHIHEPQEVPFQFVHLVYYIGIQRKNLREQKIEITLALVHWQLQCVVIHVDRSFFGCW